MSHMKVYTRLMAAFAIIIALALLLGVIGVIGSNVISSTQEKMYNENILGLDYIGQAADSFGQLRAAYYRMLTSAMMGERAGYDSAKKTIDEKFAELDKYLPLYKATLTDDPSEVAAFSDFETAIPKMKPLVEIYKTEAEKIVNGEEHSTALKQTISDTMAISDIVNDAIVTLFILNEQFSAKANEDGNNLAFMTTILQIAVIVVIAVASMIIALFIAGGIEKSLKNIIDKLSASTMNISSSAAQLTDASESLATGSSRQAASIEETSATMNETASMVSQNAENTRVASQLAATATNEVSEAGRVMESLMATMAELKESSDKVSKIVKTIDDIAFQTNLLAINATVEAARAGGDAGRSFAVVAQEVRSLAQKSASASAETAEIIERNIALTNTSRIGAERVKTIAQSNAASIADLGKLISEINAASEEQASGIKQINIAVSQMEKVTQENAAVAEENAASSNSMRDEIANLDSAISIAKELVRNADSASSGGTYQKPRSSTSSNYRPGSSTSASSSTSTVKPAKTQTTSNSAPAYKSSASNSSSNSTTSTKSDAEKIIPLDDNDDF